jgi:hypothetical protein
MGLVERDSEEDELPDRVTMGLLDNESIVVELGDKTDEPVYRIEGVSPGL